MEEEAREGEEDVTREPELGMEVASEEEQKKAEEESEESMEEEESEEKPIGDESMGGRF